MPSKVYLFEQFQKQLSCLVRFRQRSHDAGTFETVKNVTDRPPFTRKRDMFSRPDMKTVKFEKGTLIGTSWSGHREMMKFEHLLMLSERDWWIVKV